MGQKFLSNVNERTKAEIQKTKMRIKQLEFEASVTKKLEELRARPGFGDISNYTPPSEVSTSQPAATFKSSKIQLRDKNNPYNKYIEIYKRG